MRPDRLFASLVLCSIPLASAFLYLPAAGHQHVPGPPAGIVRHYEESVQRARYDLLEQQFGLNKELAPGFELQTLLALSHYPELRDTKIRFIAKDVSIPLSSRPFWGSMHRAAKDRTYLVVIDTETTADRAPLLLKNQPFNAQTGILGHELAHTAYYLRRSFRGIISDGLCQLSECRIEFERDTDRRLVAHGLGWQRYDHSRFLRRELGSGAEADESATGAYLGPRELLALMQANPAYAASLL